MGAVILEKWTFGAEDDPQKRQTPKDLPLS